MKKELRPFSIAVIAILSMLAISSAPFTSSANSLTEEGGTEKVFFSTSSPQIT